MLLSPLLNKCNLARVIAFGIKSICVESFGRKRHGNFMRLLVLSKKMSGPRIGCFLARWSADHRRRQAQITRLHFFTAIASTANRMPLGALSIVSRFRKAIKPHAMANVRSQAKIAIRNPSTHSFTEPPLYGASRIPRSCRPWR